MIDEVDRADEDVGGVWGRGRDPVEKETEQPVQPPPWSQMTEGPLGGQHLSRWCRSVALRPRAAAEAPQTFRNSRRDSFMHLSSFVSFTPTGAALEPAHACRETLCSGAGRAPSRGPGGTIRPRRPPSRFPKAAQQAPETFHQRHSFDSLPWSPPSLPGPGCSRAVAPALPQGRGECSPNRLFHRLFLLFNNSSSHPTRTGSCTSQCRFDWRFCFWPPGKVLPFSVGRLRPRDDCHKIIKVLS